MWTYSHPGCLLCMKSSKAHCSPGLFSHSTSMDWDWNELHKTPTGQINLFLFLRLPSETLIQMHAVALQFNNYPDSHRAVSLLFIPFKPGLACIFSCCSSVIHVIPVATQQRPASSFAAVPLRFSSAARVIKLFFFFRLWLWQIVAVGLKQTGFPLFPACLTLTPLLYLPEFVWITFITVPILLCTKVHQ